jgi:hypothetical protein
VVVAAGLLLALVSAPGLLLALVSAPGGRPGLLLDGGGVLEQRPPEQVLGGPAEARTRQFLRKIIEVGRP